MKSVLSSAHDTIGQLLRTLPERKKPAPLVQPPAKSEKAPTLPKEETKDDSKSAGKKSDKSAPVPPTDPAKAKKGSEAPAAPPQDTSKSSSGQTAKEPPNPSKG